MVLLLLLLKADNKGKERKEKHSGENSLSSHQWLYRGSNMEAIQPELG